MTTSDCIAASPVRIAVTLPVLSMVSTVRTRRRAILMTLYHLTPARARRLLARADDHRVVNKDEERRPPTVVSVDAFSRGAAGAAARRGCAS